MEEPEPDQARLREFLGDDLPQWMERRRQAENLLDRFEIEMSPRQLLQQPPLDRISYDTQEWLGPLVHALWLARHRVQTLLSRARLCLVSVDSAYSDLSNGVRKTRTGDLPYLLARLAAFRGFREKLLSLSEALTAFPHRIMVT